ncbi:hypothetical protein [Magnetospirillum sp. SS-4]|uniref:hypothetical protein n=1 Tax=Magnetospirillum sp. SS-4 TaxID=2681465 RepID=UPI0013812867|nr:hypothetical protein [Magnetospirillum sp. SS-4]CAA7614380.1 conserved hypothetical protein [Magnetospirillum sp. SS-4]
MLIKGTMKRIVIIVKRPLAKRDMERFGIDIALARGFSVTLFDLSEMLHPNLDNAVRFGPDVPDLDIRRLSHRRQLPELARIARKADLVVAGISSSGLSRLVLPVFHALGKVGAPYLVMAPQPIPFTAPSMQTGRLGALIRRLRSFDPLTSLLTRMPPPLLGIHHAAHVVHGSLAAASIRNNLVGPDTKVIATHSWDYDTLLRAVPSEAAADLPQAVYLDQYLPFHPDTIAMGYRAPDPALHYRQLEGLFRRIEAEYGLEVVIAAHPRADYGDKPFAYPGRRVLFGRTAELIAQSRLVLGYVSTALGIAAALNKPIGLFASQDMLNCHSMYPIAVDSIARALGTPARSQDDPESVPLAGLLDHDRAAYAAFVAHYMRHPDDPGLPLWETVFNATLA